MIQLGLVNLFIVVSVVAHAAMSPERAREQLRGLTFDGKKLVAGGECESILVRAQVRFGKRLPPKVIATMLPELVASTGERLVTLPPPISLSDSRYVGPMCFTKSMRIAMANHNQVEIGKLKAGDAVLSLDLDSGLIVINHIKQVIVSEHNSYGVLNLPKARLEVTSRERFYSRIDKSGNWDYRPIIDLGAKASLAWSEPRVGETCQLLPVRRGVYEVERATDTVYNLELVGEPRNFFVEGFLVHNMKQ